MRCEDCGAPVDAEGALRARDWVDGQGRTRVCVDCYDARYRKAIEEDDGERVPFRLVITEMGPSLVRGPLPEGTFTMGTAGPYAVTHSLTGDPDGVPVQLASQESEPPTLHPYTQVEVNGTPRHLGAMLYDLSERLALEVRSGAAGDEVWDRRITALADRLRVLERGADDECVQRTITTVRRFAKAETRARDAYLMAFANEERIARLQRMALRRERLPVAVLVPAVVVALVGVALMVGAGMVVGW